MLPLKYITEARQGGLPSLGMKCHKNHAAGSSMGSLPVFEQCYVFQRPHGIDAFVAFMEWVDTRADMLQYLISPKIATANCMFIVTTASHNTGQVGSSAVTLLMTFLERLSPRSASSELKAVCVVGVA